MSTSTQLRDPSEALELDELTNMLCDISVPEVEPSRLASYQDDVVRTYYTTCQSRYFDWLRRLAPGKHCKVRSAVWHALSATLVKDVGDVFSAVNAEINEYTSLRGTNYEVALWRAKEAQKLKAEEYNKRLEREKQRCMSYAEADWLATVMQAAVKNACRPTPVCGSAEETAAYASAQSSALSSDLDSERKHFSTIFWKLQSSHPQRIDEPGGATDMLREWRKELEDTFEARNSEGWPGYKELRDMLDSHCFLPKPQMVRSSVP